MFKWTSLVIKAVATMLLLHQTVANICTASMGPVWHIFGFQTGTHGGAFILGHGAPGYEHYRSIEPAQL